METATTAHELRFRSLFDPGRWYAFPCDVQGRIRIDVLSEAARASLASVESRVGSELSSPEIVRVLADA